MLAARAYYVLCLALGRLLRSAKYAEARIDEDGEGYVWKRRLFYAPLLVWLGNPLTRVLDTGVRVLPQHDWEERERQIYRSVHRTSIRIDGDGNFLFPQLPGKTLAAWLDDRDLAEPARKKVIESAVAALAEFHRAGWTHADAMAENVHVDGDAGTAHWFDFETVHESSRPVVWRRADDVRALLSTCLVRTVPGKRGETVQLILDVYADEKVASLLAANFASVLQRPLMFHLAQAGLSFQCFQEIGRLLRER